MRESQLRRQVQGSKLVDSPQKLEQLATLLARDPRSVKLDTLFRASDSSWSPQAFHAACDNKGASIVFVQASDGSYYGGYASVSWNSSNRFSADPAAFLFRCNPGSTGQPEKFTCNGNGNEIYNNTGYGPVFGYKHDFFCFDSAQNMFREQAHGNTPSFNLQSPLITTGVTKDAQNFQLEVLQVSVNNSASGELEHSWRTEISWSLEDAEESWKHIMDFDPAKKGCAVPHINILLCGGVGAGKSSLVCTLDALCKGRKSEKAAHGQGTGSLSRNLRKYTFKHPETGKPLKVQLWDTMGWGVNDYKKGELEYVLDGNLPDRCKLDSDVSFKTAGFKSETSIGDRVHHVCFVVPCDSATDEGYMQRFREMRDIVRSKGIRLSILLTKIDTYDPDVIGEDVKKTFHSARLESLIEDLHDSSGVGGQKDIYPVQNLSKDPKVSSEAGLLLCQALGNALNAAVDYLEDMSDEPDSISIEPSPTYNPSQDEKQAIANQDHSGQHGVLSLKKDSYYWVKPSELQGGWLPGNDGKGNQGNVLQRMVTLID